MEPPNFLEALEPRAELAALTERLRRAEAARGEAERARLAAERRAERVAKPHLKFQSIHMLCLPWKYHCG